MTPTKSDVANEVRKVIAGHSAPGQEGGATLGSLGMDSLDFVEMELEFEDRWHVVFEDLWSFDTTPEQVVADVQRLVGCVE